MPEGRNSSGGDPVIARAIQLIPVLALVSWAAAGAQPNTLAITGTTVIDVATGGLRQNTTVVIRSNVIAAVGERLQVPAGSTVVDGRGKFLIPGLWDMHAHHEGTGEASLSLFVANGVTGTRDMGSALDFILPLRQRVSSGQVLGPAIVAAGPILDDAPAAWPFRLRVRTAQEARQTVQMLKRRGVDFVKVHDHTPRDAYFAIADEAKRQGLPFAGHVPPAVTIAEAVEAGQKSIEHLANFRVFTECSRGREYQPSLCAPLFEQLARKGIWQTPTLAFMRKLLTINTASADAEADHVAYASPGLRKVWAENQQASNASPERMRAFLALADASLPAVREMHRAGVGILAGCDGLVPGFCLPDELTMMVRGGLSSLAALQTATINPARYLGKESSVGSVEPKKIADLVLLDANPIENIANIRRINAVVIGGKLLRRSELDTMLKKARDAFRPPTARHAPTFLGLTHAEGCSGRF
jgi:imidazolonepropionase-like amidohydrolase